ncbi:hypothetical protein N5J48_02420 [Acinetobacter ursingii]|jgi:hypothetical protein|uniref:hypothetical protein n=1 Tax=Acinetobacter TaxID=469 RepID=UPI002448C917|nr:hypothetical protein [Acinetobacter ursingii]MDG9858797.1 hypothetical protein [Acinetobacter ursingii]MDG9892512.1 hypothetical protein [Acinetobacter ursingii]MDH0006225.1 hypothetical protein [Acinetobacter ursingii]MDH0477763.1 hypothetical protein [Acinetobacter ursingii]MDH2118602.1 hypothetical protein [Acinetobacter ursingii]
MKKNIEKLIEDLNRTHEMHKNMLEGIKRNGIKGFATTETAVDAVKAGIDINKIYYQEIERLRSEIESYYSTLSELLKTLQDIEPK